MLQIRKTVTDGKAILAPAGRLDTLTSPAFDAAIKEIDNSIDRLQKAKEALLKSGKHLLQANGKVEDLTIKRLTKGAPSLAKEFLAVSCAED